MRIRPFKPSDAAEVARLHRGTIRTVNNLDYPRRHINVWSKRVSARKHRDSAKKQTKFVAVGNGKILGYVDYKDNEITGLYIHKDHLRKGVGTRLLKRLEKDAREHGIKKLKCTSTVTAHRFYEKNGYKTLRKTKFRIDGELLTVYRMEKKIKKLNLSSKV